MIRSANSSFQVNKSQTAAAVAARQEKKANEPERGGKHLSSPAAELNRLYSSPSAILYNSQQIPGPQCLHGRLTSFRRRTSISAIGGREKRERDREKEGELEMSAPLIHL